MFYTECSKTDGLSALLKKELKDNNTVVIKIFLKISSSRNHSRILKFDCSRMSVKLKSLTERKMSVTREEGFYINEVVPPLIFGNNEEGEGKSAKFDRKSIATRNADQVSQII